MRTFRAEVRLVRLLRHVDQLADDAHHQGAGRRPAPRRALGPFCREFRGYRYDQVCGEYYPYEQVLQDAFERVCRKWGIEADPSAGKRFADGVRSWGPHPDVPAPLKKMGDHYKLVILSNGDDSFLAESVPRLGADFHAVFTAEQAGYYKPRYGAFEYMLGAAGCRAGGLRARLVAHPL